MLEQVALRSCGCPIHSFSDVQGDVQGQHNLMGGIPAYNSGVGWCLRFLPTQAILWFYGPEESFRKSSSSVSETIFLKIMHSKTPNQSNLQLTWHHNYHISYIFLVMQYKRYILMKSFQCNENVLCHNLFPFKQSCYFSFISYSFYGIIFCKIYLYLRLVRHI